MKKQSFLQLLRSINQLAFQEPRTKKLVFITIITGILVALLPMIGEYCLALITNNLQEICKRMQHFDLAEVVNIIDSKQIKYFAMGYVAIRMVPYVLRVFDTRVSGRLNSYLEQHFDIILRRTLANLDSGYFDDSNFHDIIKNVKEKGSVMSWNFFTLQFSSLETIIPIIISSAIISFMGIEYFAILVVSMLPILVFQIWIRKKAKVFFDQTRSERRYANVYIDEVGKNETRVFSLNDKYLGTYFKLSDGILGRALNFTDKRMGAVALCWLFFGCGLYFIISHIYILIVTGQVKLGTGLFIVSSVWSFSNGIMQLIDLIASVYENIIYAQEFIGIQSLPKLVSRTIDARVITFSKGPRIAFENVSFNYFGKEKSALANVSFEIESNSKVAFVGENGGGKSTAVKLILGFYDPSHGRILVDGQDLKDISLENWRRVIGYVAQGPSVPNLKIRELLTHHDELSEDLLNESIDRVSATGFISEFKDGVNQQLGNMFKGGVALSGGQRQKLAIARAYSKNPNLLVFDEPTSDLDPKTQICVFNDFYRNNPNRTGILVAHALQGVKDADRIFVFEKGKLTESGTHCNLVNANGWYQESFEEQMNSFLSLVQ